MQKREGMQAQSPTPTHLQALRGRREWGKLGIQAAPDQQMPTYPQHTEREQGLCGHTDVVSGLAPSFFTPPPSHPAPTICSQHMP